MSSVFVIFKGKMFMCECNKFPHSWWNQSRGFAKNMIFSGMTFWSQKNGHFWWKKPKI